MMNVVSRQRLSGEPQMSSQCCEVSKQAETVTRRRVRSQGCVEMCVRGSVCVSVWPIEFTSVDDRARGAAIHDLG